MGTRGTMSCSESWINVLPELDLFEIPHSVILSCDPSIDECLASAFSKSCRSIAETNGINPYTSYWKSCESVRLPDQKVAHSHLSILYHQSSLRIHTFPLVCLTPPSRCL